MDQNWKPSKRKAENAAKAEPKKVLLADQQDFVGNEADAWVELPAVGVADFDHGF